MGVAELLGLVDVGDEAVLFELKIAGVLDQKSAAGGAVVFVRQLGEYSLFHKQLEHEAHENVGLLVIAVIDHLVGDAAVGEHLADGHLAPLGLRAGCELIDAADDLGSDVAIKDILHEFAELGCFQMLLKGPERADKAKNSVWKFTMRAVAIGIVKQDAIVDSDSRNDK